MCGSVLSANATTNLTNSTVSTPGWLVASPTDLSGSNFVNPATLTRYDYDFFKNRVQTYVTPGNLPSTVSSVANLTTNGVVFEGIYYLKSSGNVTFSSDLSLGKTKVVVLVDGTVNLNGRINFDSWNGSDMGLFVLLAGGNVTVGGTVGDIPPVAISHLEGVYLTNGIFDTGTSLEQLKVSGVVAAGQGLAFNRTLGQANPSEYFIFRPDVMMQLPRTLKRQNTFWTEVP